MSRVSILHILSSNQWRVFIDDIRIVVALLHIWQVDQMLSFDRRLGLQNKHRLNGWRLLVRYRRCLFDTKEMMTY